jgi:RimJ/RimL family protein N-acetyltransferase
MAERDGPPAADVLDDVQLVPVTFENAPALAELFLQRDVWRNFGYESPPSSFALRLRLGQGDMTGLLFHRPSLGRAVGFVLGFGRVGPEASLEFAIAVPDPAERRRSLGKVLGMRAVSWFFEQQLCGSLWAWGDAKNTAMLALVRACDWEVVGFEEGGREMVDGRTETVEVRMTRERWLGWRARQNAG